MEANASSITLLMFAWISCRGPPRDFDGDRPRFGDRDGYRGGPRAAPGDFGGEKGGAPAEFQPSFRVIDSFFEVEHTNLNSVLSGMKFFYVHPKLSTLQRLKYLQTHLY